MFCSCGIYTLTTFIYKRNSQSSATNWKKKTIKNYYLLKLVNSFVGNHVVETFVRHLIFTDIKGPLKPCGNILTNSDNK